MLDFCRNLRLAFNRLPSFSAVIENSGKQRKNYADFRCSARETAGLSAMIFNVRKGGRRPKQNPARCPDIITAALLNRAESHSGNHGIHTISSERFFSLSHREREGAAKRRAGEGDQHGRLHLNLTPRCCAAAPLLRGEGKKGARTTCESSSSAEAGANKAYAGKRRDGPRISANPASSRAPARTIGQLRDTVKGRTVAPCGAA